MSLIIYALIQITILAYALVGGVFLAFSDFIMRSLSLTSGAGGAEAMQAINREVFRWIFMVLFIGLAPVSVILLVHGVWFASGVFGMLISAGALLYLLGCFAVTVFFNVPMNEALAGLDASSQAAQEYWRDTYLPRWTFWNTIRAVACIVSACLFLAAVAWVG